MKCTHTFRKIISTHKWKLDPTIYTYWLRCKTCGHQWKVYCDKPTGKEIPIDKLPNKNYCKFTKFKPGQIKKILLDERTDEAVARDYGVTHQAINQIRVGKSYKTVCADIPRRMARKVVGLVCKKCDFWWGGQCSLDVPEAGSEFASDCAYFKKAC